MFHDLADNKEDFLHALSFRMCLCLSGAETQSREEAIVLMRDQEKSSFNDYGDG